MAKRIRLFDNKYEIIEELGEGRWGFVYKVREGNKTLALKGVDAGSTKQFRSIFQEFKILSRLDHPNIVKVYSLNLSEKDQSIYYTMEYVNGSSIRSYFKSCTFDSDVTKSLLLQICNALSYIHRQNIVHMDLKPENILIQKGKSGLVVKVSDFGLAELFDKDQSEDIGLPILKGTYPYMSPEMIAGKQVDYRSDFYSLGVILYEWFSGRNPFLHDSVQAIISAHLNRTPVALEEIVPGFSRELSQIILQLLAKEPSFRPGSADEIAVMLHIAEDTPIHPPPITTGMFVGQHLARKEIHSAFEKACTGSGGLILIHGPKGIGKSRLLEDAKSDFQLSGADIIDLQAHPESKSYLDLFRELTLRLRKIYPRIPPDLPELIFGLPIQHELYRSGDLESLKDLQQQAIKMMLKAMQVTEGEFIESPTVIIIRDFHADEEAPWSFFKQLAFLWDTWAADSNIPVLWLIESRSDYGQDIISKPIRGRFIHVEPVALSIDETSILLSSLLGVTPFPHKLAEQIHELSEGNPAIINVIAQTIHRSEVLEWKEFGWRINMEKLEDVELSEDINRLYKTQLQSVPPDLRILLSHAALWPDYFTLDSLLITLPKDINVIDLMQKALIQGFLTKHTEEGEIYFKLSDQSIRNLALNYMPGYEQVQCHLAIADHLKRRSSVREDEIAYHLLAGDNRLEGCERAAQAADTFAKGNRHGLAVKWYRMAIDNMPDKNSSKIATLNYRLAQSLFKSHKYQEALEALDKSKPVLDSRFYQKREKALYLMLFGLCHQKLGHVKEAIEQFRRAMDYLPKTTAMDIRLKLLAFYSHALSYIKERKKSIEMIHKALHDLPLFEHPYYAGLLLEKLAIIHYQDQNYEEAERLIKRSISFGENISNPVALIERFTLLGMVYQNQGKNREAFQEYQRVISLAKKDGDPVLISEALLKYASLKIYLDQPGNAEELLKEAFELAERVGRSDLMGYSLTVLGNFYVSRGNLQKARELLNKAQELLGKVDQFDILSSLYLDLAKIEIRHGNWSVAIKQYDTLLKKAREQKNLTSVGYCYMYMANTFKYMRNWAKATVFIQRCKRIFKYLSLKLPDVNVLEAEIALGMDNIRKALTLGKNGLAEAKKQNLIQTQAYALQVLGKIYHKQGKFEKARQYLEESITLYEKSKSLFEMAVSIFYLGELYQTTADIEKSRMLLERSRNLFRDQGAHHYHERVSYALDALDQSSSLAAEHTDPILMTFSQIASLINSITNPDVLLERILNIAIRFVNAERGMIVMIDPDTKEPEIKAVRNLDSTTSRDASMISRTVLIETTLSESGISTGDAPSDPNLSTIKSVKAYNILSLICVPMKIQGKPLGAIYVDSRRVTNLFSERDRNFLLAFADLAAVAIERSMFYEQQLIEKEFFKKEVQERYRFANLIGKSKIMKEVFHRLDIISRTDSSVLITGSNGTGKELAARAIHYNSHRKNKRFVAVNCAAIPESLFESELFGHAKGSFTDAKTDKPGRFEQADGGTLFLDEIGELPLRIQVKLLRVIQEKEINRLGETKPRKIDIRIISATNKDLRAAIQQNTFREDFYYRLRVAEIHMPDLKDRPEDIPILARHFLQKACQQTGKKFDNFTPKAFEALMYYSWPGNVRELEHAIESAVVFGNPPQIDLKDLPQEIRVPFAKSGAAFGKPELRSMDEMEEAHIRAILMSTGGNKLKACQILKISRPTLDRKLEKFNINIKEMKNR